MVISVSNFRVSLLVQGRPVIINQDGMRLKLVPELYCCKEMRAMSESLATRRIAAKFNNCPFCKTSILKVEQVAKRTSSLKGRTHYTDPVTKRRIWVEKGKVPLHIRGTEPAM